MTPTHYIKRQVSRKGRIYVGRGEKCIIHPDYAFAFAIFGQDMREHIKVISIGGHTRMVTPKNLVEIPQDKKSSA